MVYKMPKKCGGCEKRREIVVAAVTQVGQRVKRVITQKKGK